MALQVREGSAQCPWCFFDSLCCQKAGFGCCRKLASPLVEAEHEQTAFIASACELKLIAVAQLAFGPYAFAHEFFGAISWYAADF